MCLTNKVGTWFASVSRSNLIRWRTTVVWMETLAKGDMSVSVLVGLLAAAGYDLKPVRQGARPGIGRSWPGSDAEMSHE